jgi:transcriptional regulator GlxA family with amidase domain
MIKDVINQGGDPPKNKLRKVIFKPYSGLDLSGKLKIVGQLIGRSKVDNSMIYDAMLYIRYDLKQKVTISKIANILGCSARTIYRNMDNYLKIEKYTLNEEI